MPLPVYRITIKDKDYEQLKAIFGQIILYPRSLMPVESEYPYVFATAEDIRANILRNPMKSKPRSIRITLMQNMMTLLNSKCPLLSVLHRLMSQALQPAIACCI